MVRTLLENLFFVSLIIFIILTISQLILEFLKPKLRINNHKYQGEVTVIVPVRGHDVNRDNNIRSLREQNYNNYNLIFVVDPDDTEVIEYLEKQKLKYVLTEDECNKCSGKIRAILTGIKYTKGDIIIFGDSDAYFGKNWIDEMVYSLRDSNVATSYPWPYPLNYKLSNLIRSSILLLLQEPKGIFPVAWGGSLAIRREFLTTDLIDRLKNSVCDDCVITTYAHERKEKINYSNRSIIFNYFDEDKVEEWADRQITYAISYYKVLLIVFVMIFILYYGGILLGIIILTPLVLLFPLFWFLKNAFRGSKYFPRSLLISLASSLLFGSAMIVLIHTYRNKKIRWRDKEYDKGQV